MLMYSSRSLGILVYMDSDFQWDIDSSKISSKMNLANPFYKDSSRACI